MLFLRSTSIFSLHISTYSFRARLENLKKGCDVKLLKANLKFMILQINTSVGTKKDGTRLTLDLSL